MSFADPLAFTWNAVVKNLTRVNQDSNGSDFYFDGGTEKFSAAIRHTIPPKGGTGESHMLRLDVDHYDANSVFIRRGSVWVVAKSFDTSQNSTTMGYNLASLVGALTVGNQGKLLAREV